MLLVPKNYKMLPFFCFSWFVFINFDSQESKFPMMLIMFLNMLWRAESFGYSGVQFDFGSFNNF